MKARDVMTTKVHTVEAASPVLQAVRLMLQNRISGLPVVEDGDRLVGIVTEGDFLRRAETGTEQKRPRWLEFLMGGGQMADDYVRTHARKVGDVMTTELVTVTEDTPLDEVVSTMERRRIKRVPVVRGGRLVGIVSRANLLHALASVVPAMPAATADDAEIRRTVLNTFASQSWAPAGALEVVVLNGVVDIWGTILDERTRRAVIVAAEGVPGVKSVRDHMAWVDPMSGTVFAAPEMSPDRALVS